MPPMPVDIATVEETPLTAKRAKSLWRLLRNRWLKLLVTAAIVWMGSDAVLSWLIQQWLPRIISVEAIERDIRTELARATQLEPSWDNWDIHPTLFHGLRITVNGLQFRENPGAVKDYGVNIPTPATFQAPVPTSGFERQSTARRALVRAQSFRLHLRYWPMLTKRHLQIGHIQLDGLRLLGGDSGVFSHYFPIIYDADYGKKFFKKKDPPTYMADATLRLHDVSLSQSSPEVSMMPARRLKPAESATQLSKNSLGFHFNDIEVRHLVSTRPLSLGLSGTAGVFEAGTLDTPSPDLNHHFDRWNRDFRLDAESRTTGDDPDKAFAGSWGVNDLKKLSFEIKPSALMNQLSGETIKGDISLASGHSGKPRHQWNTSVHLTDLSLLTDALEQTDVLFGYHLPQMLRSFHLAGRVETDAKGQLLWPSATSFDKPPELLLDDAHARVEHLALGYDDPIARRRVALLNRFDGDLNARKNKWTFDNLRLLVGKSPLTVSGQFDGDKNVLNADGKIQDLSINQLLQSFAQVESTLAQLAPEAVTPDMKRLLTQWEQQQLRVQGTVNADVKVAGPLEKLDYTGDASLTDGSIYYAQANATPIEASAIQARISVLQDFRLNHFSANIFSSTLNATATADKQFEHILADAKLQNLKLATVLDVLKDTLPEADKKNLDAIAALNGNADGTVRYQYDKPGNRHDIRGGVNIHQFALTPDLKNGHKVAPIEFNQLALQLNGDKITLPKTTGKWGPIPLHLDATAQWPWQQAKPQLTLKSALSTGQMPIGTFRDNRAFFESLLSSDLTYPHFWNTTGQFSLDAQVTEKNLDAALHFANAGASWEGCDFPLYDVNGALRVKDSWATLAKVPDVLPNVTAEQLQGRYGNSPIKIQTEPMANGPKMTLRGRLSPLTLNHFLTSSQSTYAPYEMIPLRFEVVKQPLPELPPDVYVGRLFLGLNRMLVEPPKETKEGMEAINFPQVQANPEQYRQNAQSRAYLMAEFGMNTKPSEAARAKYPDVQVYPSKLHLAEYGDIWLAGHLNHVLPEFDWTKMAGELHLLTSPVIDMKGIGEKFRSDIFQGAKGTLASDVTLTLNPSTPDNARSLSGWVEMNAVQLPKFLIEDVTGNIAFQDQRSFIDLPSIHFQGAELSLKAEAAQVMQYPIHLDNVVIQGNSFNLPAIQQFNTDIVEDMVVENGVRRFAARPWQEGDPMLPVEFKNAKVNLNEVVYENILLQNFKSNLSVYANSFVEFADADVDLAGGKLQGYLQLNPFDNNFVSLDMKTDGVKANALTRALLGVTNQIFGDVNATIRFTTQGSNDDEMMRNANGTVSMKVANGRLPALSHVETLLTAANLLRGGILGFNINNLLRTVAPFRAQYFAELSGDLLIADKQLHTDNLLSDGRNLDLLMEGSVTMDTGIADMYITGTMNQDVNGGLGGLGKLSLGRLLRFVPILGFNPLGVTKVKAGDKVEGNTPGPLPAESGSIISDPGLLYRIPGLGYVPGLGGPAKDVNRFRIKMQGPPQDPASIKSFGWLRE